MPTTAARLSSKFQIAIPKAVREELRWEVGQKFVFIPKGKGLLLMPVPQLEELAGIAEGARKEGHRDRKDRFERGAELPNCDAHCKGLPGAVLFPKTPVR